jgi:hypothetical protein
MPVLEASKVYQMKINNAHPKRWENGVSLDVMLKQSANPKTREEVS